MPKRRFVGCSSAVSPDTHTLYCSQYHRTKNPARTQRGGNAKLKTGHGPYSSQLVNCVVLCIVCVQMCTALYYCHRVSTKLQLKKISYRISYHIIPYIISYIISYHIIPSDSKAGSMTHSVLCYVNVRLKPFNLNYCIYSLCRVLWYTGHLVTTEYDVLKPIHTQIWRASWCMRNYKKYLKGRKNIHN